MCIHAPSCRESVRKCGLNRCEIHIQVGNETLLRLLLQLLVKLLIKLRFNECGTLQLLLAQGEGLWGQSRLTHGCPERCMPVVQPPSFLRLKFPLALIETTYHIFSESLIDQGFLVFACIQFLKLGFSWLQRATFGLELAPCNFRGTENVIDL